MKEFQITIDDKKYTAKKPTVGNLKDFLLFQKEFNSEDGFNLDAFDRLCEIILSIMPELDYERLSKMDVSQYIKAASDIASWMSYALSGNGNEKN